MENLEETAEKLLSFEGKAKGEIFRKCLDYIRQKEGEEGVRKVEEKVREVSSIDIDKVKSLNWVKEGVSSLTIITAKELFDWDDDEVYRMGSFVPKTSFITKILVRHFASREKVFREAPRYWSRHCDFGEMESVELSEEGKYVILRLKGFRVHPVICKFHGGYIKGFAEIGMKGKNIKVEEVKCPYRGDDYHEYKLTWE